MSAALAGCSDAAGNVEVEVVGLSQRSLWLNSPFSYCYTTVEPALASDSVKIFPYKPLVGESKNKSSYCQILTPPGAVTTPTPGFGPSVTLRNYLTFLLSCFSSSPAKIFKNHRSI